MSVAEYSSGSIQVEKSQGVKTPWLCEWSARNQHSSVLSLGELAGQRAPLLTQ